MPAQLRRHTFPGSPVIFSALFLRLTDRLMKNILLVTVLLALSFAGFSQTRWTTTEFNVSFHIKNAGITVSGNFEGFKGNLVFSPDQLEKSSLSATVEAVTIKTGIDMRDRDLQEEKYFNSGQFPLIAVASQKLYRKGAQYAGLFNVSIKGVTKQIEIPFEYTETGDTAEFKGSFTMNRRDFGVGGKTLTMAETLDVNILVKAKK